MAGRADIDEFEKNSANSDRVYLFTGLNEWKNAGCGERYGKVQGYNRYSTVEDKAKFNGTSPAHEFARYLTNADENIAVGIVSNAIGGTSIIILVGVALETVAQIESQMMMRHYKGFLD